MFSSVLSRRNVLFDNFVPIIIFVFSNHTVFNLAIPLPTSSEHFVIFLRVISLVRSCRNSLIVIVWSHCSITSRRWRRWLECLWKASNAESDRLIYRAACSFAKKLINKSHSASNIESINEASKNPKRLWSTIKSLLHSSLPSEQLSPFISQPLANSLASFFHQKIVALKESIYLKLLGNPSPFDFD